LGFQDGGKKVGKENEKDGKLLQSKSKNVQGRMWVISRRKITEVKSHEEVWGGVRTGRKKEKRIRTSLNPTRGRKRKRVDAAKPERTSGPAVYLALQTGVRMENWGGGGGGGGGGGCVVVFLGGGGGGFPRVHDTSSRGGTWSKKQTPRHRNFERNHEERERGKGRGRGVGRKFAAEGGEEGPFEKQRGLSAGQQG